MRKKTTAIVLVLSLLIFGFWYINRDPITALRTELFSQGYFYESQHSEIREVGPAANGNGRVYEVTPAPHNHDHIELKSYSVEHVLFYYSVDYYGEV